MSNASKNSIKFPGYMSDFKTSLEMVADPTPQGVIYPLGDGWGFLRFKVGYKKVLLSTHPLVIKKVDGPILNLHAQPLIPNTCHVASSKQCEAIAESTGKRCEWKLSAARRGDGEGVKLATRLGQGFDFCTRHMTQENSRATILEVYRSKLRSGFLPPTNSFLLSPNECLTVDWVKPPTARPTPSLTASTTTMPAPSSSSSSSAAHLLTLSATSAPSSSVTDLARRMTDEEEEEWKDLPWNWQDTGRVRVVTSDHQIPEVSEIKRFVKALAKGAEGLQVRGSLITKADGEVDELYCDLFTALEDCIITYATKHRNQFPFISEWMKNMPDFDDNKATTGLSISGLSQASSSSHTSSQPPHSQPLPSEEERSDCAVMMMESEEGESEETRLMEYDIVERQEV
eukprot:g67743.t1